MAGGSAIRGSRVGAGPMGNPHSDYSGITVIFSGEHVVGFV